MSIVLWPVADLHTKVSGDPPSTNRTQFFHFYIHFRQKAPTPEIAPSPTEGRRPPLTRNPGSAPDGVLSLGANDVHLT